MSEVARCFGSCGGEETSITSVDVAKVVCCGRSCSRLPEGVAVMRQGLRRQRRRGAGGDGFKQRTQSVHTYSKDEVGHFITRLTTFYSEAMDDVGFTDEQIVDVVHRVSDKLTIDLLTRDYGEIPAPSDD
jgi:hypothetical protein